MLHLIKTHQEAHESAHHLTVGSMPFLDTLPKSWPSPVSRTFISSSVYRTSCMHLQLAEHAATALESTVAEATESERTIQGVQVVAVPVDEALDATWTLHALSLIHI